MDVEGGIEAYIRDEILAPQGRGAEAFTRETSLFRTGIVDSFGLLDLVGFIEKQYTIRVGEEDMLPANFDTVVRLARFVEDRQRTQPA